MSVTTQVKPVTTIGFTVPKRRRQIVPTSLSQTLIWFGAMVIIIGPLIPVFIASVWTTPLYETDGSLTVQNYVRLFSDPTWWEAVKNSVIFSVLTTVGAVFFGTAMAVLVTRTDLPGRKIYAGLTILPLVFPGLVLILGWSTFWAPFGYGSAWIENYTFFSNPINLNSILGMSIVGVTMTSPIIFFFVRSVVVSIDSSLEEAARVSGASPLRAVMSATVPMLRPAILNSSVLVFAVALEVLGLALILGKSAGIEVIGTYLYTNWVEKIPSDQGKVSAGAVCLLLVVAVLLLLRNKLSGDPARFTAVSGKPKASQTISLGPVRWVISVVLAIVFGISVILPIIAVALSAFTSTLSPFVNPFSVLTLDNFSRVLANDMYVSSITNSLLIATIGGVFTTAIVALLSLIAHRSTFLFRHSLQQGMLWPRAIPGLVTGMGFFWAYAVLDPSGGLRATLFALALAFAVRNVALAYSAFYPTLASIGEDMDRAARTSGASWWRASVGIALRIARPAISVSFVLLFVALLNEVDPAVFLVTASTPVMGLTMLQITMDGTSGPVAAFGVIQLVLTMGVLGLGRLIFGVRTHV